jgi:hypothetical protein
LGLIFTVPVIFVFAVWKLFEYSKQEKLENPPVEEAQTAATIVPTENVNAQIFFPKTDLSGVQQFVLQLPNSRSVATAWVAALLAELSRAPAGYPPVFQSPITPRSVFLNDQGTLFVDFPSEALDAQNGGVEVESLSLVSLTKTLISNVEGAKKLKILANGADRETFWGHVYILEPIEIN